MRLFGRRTVRASATTRSPRVRCGVEGLESRVLFALDLVADLPNTAVAPGTGSSEVPLSDFFDDDAVRGTVVRLTTDLGNIDIELFDTAAPANVANFLGYVSRGDYNNTFFHRAIAGFVVQGGGYKVNPAVTQIDTHIQTQSPVQNEFSPQRSNTRGTVAMAKVPGFEDLNNNGAQDPGEPEIAGGGPNSATSEFFFNVEDNSGTNPFGLDFQNGGFTVFARAINNTMAVVDAIAGLPAVNDPQSGFNSLPIQGALPVTADELVELANVRIVPEAAVYSYAVTSSNPGLVTGGVENGVLRLNYGAGQIGTADITVTATDASGASVSDTFTAGVGVLPVTIGDGGARAVTFTDADGTAATISVKGGAARVEFSGSNLSETLGKGGSTVAGTITDLSVAITGGGASAALTVKAAGGADGRINVNSLTADGGVKSIAAKQANVLGDVTIAGAVGRADFADVSNAVLSFGGSGGGGGAALSLLAANAVDIVSQAPIRSLKADSFVGGGPDVGVITAPALGSLTVSGDFGQQLNLAGALGTTRIGGAASTFLPWSVGGPAGKLTLGSTAEGFVADFLGGVAALTVNGSLTGDIAAPFVRALTVKGDMTSANLTVTGPGAALGRATVSGAMVSSRIQATNGIGAVTAGAINASTIYAGLTTDGGILPTSLDEFNPGPSDIKSVTVRGGSPGFVNSSIAARTIGRLNLGTIQAGNGGVPFGVAADSIAAVTGAGDAAIGLSRLTEPGQSQTQQDFTVRVL